MKNAPIVVWLAGATLAQSQAFHPQIPKTWDQKNLESMEVPASAPRYSPVPVPAEYYYSTPVRPVYRAYPVYAPGREPAGYMESLRNQEPKIIFDPAQLLSERDWIKAGELVFDAPFGFDF